MNFSPFSCPIFLGHPEARGRCSQGEQMLYGRDLVPFGRSRESRSREAAGRRNWPEAVPRKMSGRKRDTYATQMKSARGGGTAEKVNNGIQVEKCVSLSSLLSQRMVRGLGRQEGLPMIYERQRWLTTRRERSMTCNRKVRTQRRRLSKMHCQFERQVFASGLPATACRWRPQPTE